MSFARTGVLADAYRPGQGATAHLLPLPPVYAGPIYRAFCVRTVTLQAVEFRIWKGGLAMTLAMAVLWALLQADCERAISNRLLAARLTNARTIIRYS